MERLTANEIAGLDPYKFMAVIGKRVIHPGGRASTDALLNAAGITSSSRVLDVGCGVGTTAIEIARRFGAAVTAVDIAPLMLERARANLQAAGVTDRVTVKTGDILDLAYPDGAFDVVIAEAVTMFVDRQPAAAELARVCAPGGRVLATEFLWRQTPTAEAREVFLGQVCPSLQFDTLEDWTRIYAGTGLTGLETVTGPFEMMSPKGFLADEGFGHSMAIMRRVAARPAHLRKMMWLMPRMAKAVPYLGYVLVVGHKPDRRSDMINVHSFVDEGLGLSSYLIALGDGTAVLIDPPRFPTAHRSLADRLDVRIRWTFDTHSHADYVTGSPNLAARDGITFVAPAASDLATPHQPIHDADRVDVADAITLTAIATPGHTPDHHAYLLTDHGRPVGLFTGGSLMVGTVGRTNLCGPDLAVPLAHEMFRSLRRFDDLPDDLVVYPTHGAGSFCSAPGMSQRTSTLGHERATNPLLTIRSEDEFVEQLVGGFGTFPTYFARLPEVNRLGPTSCDTIPRLQPLTAANVEEHQANGGVVVDARPIAAFAAGHLPGSISNTLRPVFASWLGWLTEADRPIVFILDTDQNRDDLVRQCLDIGHERLVGELVGGIEAWTTAGHAVSIIPLVEPDAITTVVVDVRQVNEYTSGHLPEAVNIELGQIPTAELPAGPITVMCGHGERAMTAASVLAARGRRYMAVLDGGPDTWSTITGRPLETGR